MKHTKMQNEFLLLKQIALFISVVLCMVFMQGIFVSAAEKTITETADYSVKAVEETAGNCKIIFTPSSTMKTVDIHYKVNNGDQQNVGTVNEGNNWTYTISNVTNGSSLDIFFTYINPEGAGVDSPWMNYVVGSAASDNNNNTPNNGDQNNNNNPDNNQQSNTQTNIRIEAENYSTMSGVQNDGWQITNVDTNNWMRYALNIPTSGSYRILVRGKADGDRDGLLVFRDTNRKISTVSVTNHSDYNDFRSEAIDLAEGNLFLTVVSVAGKSSIDWIEFEPVNSGNSGNQGDNGNQGGNGNQGDNGNQNDNENQGNNGNQGDNGNQGNNGNQGGNGNQNYDNLGVSIPVEDTSIPDQDGKMIFQFNNLTNGAYSDDQIYWCALGYRPGSMELCYVDAQGNLHDASPGLNDTALPNDRKSSRQIVNTIAQSNKHVYMPSIISGRMYISYGKPIDIEFNVDANGRVGFAGPNMDAANDPNAETYFEFMEFTIGLFGGAVDEPTHYWGNTTRVDNFCFPVVSRLIGENRGYDEAGNVVSSKPYDKTVGDIEGRDYLRNEFINNAPDAFKNGLVDDYRIFAPCKKTFNEGQPNGGFFDDTINQFWDKYSREDLVLHCQGGDFRGRTNGNILEFTDERTGSTGRIDKPSTQDVLEGRGAFDRRTQPGLPGDLELVLEAQLCAAFNRGLALSPTSDWYDVSKYYQNYPYNYYAGFWHQHGVSGLGYGFCYDDVNDQSTLLECNTAKKLIIDLKWN